ncbi:MAG: hypothetical protein ABJQ29_11385 [Luteolibacter sp.]
MKTKPHTAATSQKTAAPTTGDPTPIDITTEEGMKIRERSAKTGLTAIPCPFCKRTDSLEIIHWTSERKDGAEYEGDAVKCNRCDCIASVDSWTRLGTPRL